MADQSHLDSRYFVDNGRYNCPFCGRRHVVFFISDTSTFDWTNSKKCAIVNVTCASCRKVSMHLSFMGLDHLMKWQNSKRVFNPKIDIDAALFYSVPTSFHSVDSRIPKRLRELVTEAQGCLKSNFLTGASACTRKVVYELAKSHKAEGDNYDSKIKSLKDKFDHVDPSFFDTLLTIQQVTSDKVHENSYDSWSSHHLRLILATLIEILQEIYVIPAIREEKRKSILELKNEVLGEREKAHETEATNSDKAQSANNAA